MLSGCYDRETYDGPAIRDDTTCACADEPYRAAAVSEYVQRNCSQANWHLASTKDQWGSHVQRRGF